MIAFRLDIVPPKATSQSAGKRMAVVNGKPMFFKNKKAQSAENDLLLLCSPHVPLEPMAGPLALHVDLEWPWRKSEPKYKRKLGRIPMTSKPDCSNAVKHIEDTLTKLQFWKDDSQVTDLRVTKGWGDRPGISIRIESAGGGDNGNHANRATTDGTIGEQRTLF